MVNLRNPCMKIILSGGGTLGPVVPLLAIAEVCRSHHSDTEFLWVGTKNGPEKTVVEASGMKFTAIGAGKWRRYFSLWNIADIWRVGSAFFQSLIVLWEFKPQVLISAGGFVSVPLHWAAALLGIPTWVHQQDLRIGLANRLMFPFAYKITTALQETAAKLPQKKTEWLGNPSRNLQGVSLKEAYRFFNIPSGAPVIFALGGGTGSNTINTLVAAALPSWPSDWHIIHLIGKGRSAEMAVRSAKIFSNYHVFDFFTTEMRLAYALSRVVIARAGFATITEVAALAKPAILVPMSGTHQEENAAWFANRQGVIVLNEQIDSGLKLGQIVKHLVDTPSEAEALGQRLHLLLPAAKPERIAAILDKLIEEKK